MSNRLNYEDVPEITGWVTLPEAARMMKLSRQYVHRMAVNGAFTSLHRVGSTFVLNIWEVMDLIGNTEVLDKTEPSD